MPYEVDFLPVGEGSGDALLVRYGDEQGGSHLHVIDGGRTATALTIENHIEKFYPGHQIEHMVLSHADDDHATGLVGVMKKYTVKHLWMNRPWLYAAEIIDHFHGNYSINGLIAEIKRLHPYLVELEDLANEKGTIIHEVFQGARIGQFTVLAPKRERYVNTIHDFGKTPDSYRVEESSPVSSGIFRFLDEAKEKVKRWLEENWQMETLAKNTETSASNESCVVQYGNLGKGVLLTADVGPLGLAEAHEYFQTLGLPLPKFVQVPHHGSRHNVTPSVLDKWLGPTLAQRAEIGTAFCSVGSNKTDYPRGQVTNAFIRRGFKVYCTRTKWLSHYSGTGHDGAIAATAEEFQEKVEGL